MDSCYVHHNRAFNTAEFSEIGGGSSKDCIMAYNVYITTRGQKPICLHIHDTFASTIHNLRFENNTIVCLSPGKQGWVLFDFKGDPTSGTFLLRNNIVYYDNYQTVTNSPSFTHDHNLLYSASGPITLGFSLGPGEVVAKPNFVDVTRFDPRLSPTSPALHAGVPLGYRLDFNNKVVRPNAPPDIGAFEYWNDNVVYPRNRQTRNSPFQRYVDNT